MDATTGAGAGLVPAVVAPGRTIVDETGEKVGPGGFAKIKRGDFKELLALGFVVGSKSDRKTPAKVKGPTVTVTTGPSVTRVA